jgi:hypothetical protein
MNHPFYGRDVFSVEGRSEMQDAGAHGVHTAWRIELAITQLRRRGYTYTQIIQELKDVNVIRVFFCLAAE